MKTDGIGIDIVELSRFEGSNHAKLVERILSEKEKAIYHTFTSRKRQVEFLAGRFAAKEAFTKAHRGFEEHINFSDVSVLYDEYGAPIVESPFSTGVVQISIAHSDHYAVAMCTVKGESET